MPETNETPSPAQVFLDEIALPILSGEWITWDEQPAAVYSAKVKQFVELAGVLRQRRDEQLDSAQNVGKFAKLERFRKARSDGEERVDPVQAAVAAMRAALG